MSFVKLEEVLQNADARHMGRALILTALGSEIRGVLAHLKPLGSVRGRGGMIYECGEFNGSEIDWLIVVAQSEPGNQAAQAVTLTAHHDFDRFDVMMFVGVAGSRKSDVPIGSVIASKRVYSPYGGKFEPDGMSSRPLTFPTPTELVQLAMKVERDEQWQLRIKPIKGGLPIDADEYPQPFPPSAFVAPIVSVEAVMANPQSELEKHIALHFGDAHGVEMEGFGTAFGANVERTPAIVIRGISDMTVHKRADTDAVLQPIAVAHACAFAFELLSLLVPARSLDRVTVTREVTDHTVATQIGSEAPLKSEAGMRPFEIESTSPPLPRNSTTDSQSPAGASVDGTRFVLNLAGSLDDLLPEQLEAVLAAIRDVTGDQTMHIVRIEKGSVRIFVSAQRADVEQLNSIEVREAVSNAGAVLLGAVEVQEFLNLQAIKEELSRASHDLATWPQTLPGGERLERSELGVVLGKLKQLECSTTVLLGPPGSGKSALLARVAQEVVILGWPVLGIKADILDAGVSNEAGLQQQLMLDARPSTLLSRLAHFGPTVLIIDQLDALAGFVDLRTGRLNVLLHLVRRLSGRRNIHIVLSARTFEFNHDVRLRSIEADTLNLELPPWRDILPVLTARNLQPDGWPADAQETLRTPQHLATFLRLADSGATEPFQNYQAMLERLWIERVLQAENGERLARLATEIAETMAAEESLWLARSRYDAQGKDLLDLERLEILTSSADGLAIGFTHQTLYDYVLARSFVGGKGRLSTYVAGREASLFLRPKLWVALTYLRNVEVTTYERELTTIWRSEGLRPHLKLLLIEFMGQQKTPTETERRLMRPVLELESQKAAGYRAITGSPGWFEAMAGSVIPAAMQESEESAWLVAGVLQQSWTFAPERALNLIGKHWAPDPKYDPQIWVAISEAPEWNDDLLGLAVEVLQRTQIAPFHVERVIAHLGIQQPDKALRLVRASLDRDLASALKTAAERATTRGTTESTDLLQLVRDFQNSPRKPLEDLLDQSRDWDVLTTFAETEPKLFLDSLWPWLLNVLRELARFEGPQSRDVYPLRWSLAFRLDEEDDGFNLPSPSIVHAVQVAVEKLAENPNLLRSWLKENSTVELAPVQRLLAHALSHNGKEYALDAFEFLMGDSRRFYLGGHADESGTTKALVRAASPHWSLDQRAEFVRRVRTYRPPAVLGDDVERKRVRLRGLRRLRLGLLKALPQENLEEEVKSYVRQETRVFGEEPIGIHASIAGFVGSPMSTEAMLKASDTDILNAFREIPDRVDWDHPREFLKGGNIELSRAFAEFAKQQPQRAALIIARFEPGMGSRAAGYALDSMAEVTAPDLVVKTFLDAARRGFVGEEFRTSAARAIERLVDRNTSIGNDVVTVLEGWLTDATESFPDTSDDNDVQGHAKTNEERDVRSILWDGHHFSILPHGNFPILEALTRIFLARNEHDRAFELWNEHLARRENPKVWRALLRFLPYIRPSDENARSQLLNTIFARYPDIFESVEGVHLLAYAQWWASDQVRGIMESWRERSEPWLQQVIGEMGGLIALVQPELDWAVDLMNEGLLWEASVERKIGIAFAAANLWENPKFRSRANSVMLILIPQAEEKLWSAILDIFRVVDDFDAPETAILLDAMATHIRKAGRQTNTFIIERLQRILPDHAVIVGQLAKGVVANLRDELGDLRTGAAATAPALVDVAITLHRLGGETREVGVELFEELLIIDAYSARTTLEEIDNRFRATPHPVRPRLPRRPAKTRRRRVG